MNVTRFLTDHLEVAAFYVSIVATSLGIIAFCLVFFAWSWLRPRYREFWAKCGVAFFRALAAVSAIAAKTVNLNANKSPWEQPWTLTVLIAVAGYLLWEITGAIGDHKSKLSKEKTSADHEREIDDLQAAHREALSSAAQEVEAANQDRKDAEFEALRLNRLLTHLRWSVSEKHQRVRRVIRETAGVRASIQQVRDGLAPEEQIHILLEMLASLFSSEVESADVHCRKQNFRVGLFVERDGQLVPLDAFDLATRDHEPFSSYGQHADRYRLDNNTNPSHAVRCVREGRTIIVADCESEPEFEFFNDRQRKYLLSMVAHPLDGFRPDGINAVNAALLIDTNKSRFFCEEDREMVELLLNEFVVRIGLEYAIGGLTSSSMTQRGGGDERKRTGPNQNERRRSHRGPVGKSSPGDTKRRSQAQEGSGGETPEASTLHGEGEDEVNPY